MGWFIGRYVYETHMSHLAHKHASLVPMIVPQFVASQRSLGVTLLFGEGAATSGFEPGLSPAGGLSYFPGRR